jgi:hypothetical protein
MFEPGKHGEVSVSVSVPGEVVRVSGRLSVAIMARILMTRLVKRKIKVLKGKPPRTSCVLFLTLTLALTLPTVPAANRFPAGRHRVDPTSAADPE